MDRLDKIATLALLGLSLTVTTSSSVFKMHDPHFTWGGSEWRTPLVSSLFFVGLSLALIFVFYKVYHIPSKLHLNLDIMPNALKATKTTTMEEKQEQKQNEKERQERQVYSFTS